MVATEIIDDLFIGDTADAKYLSDKDFFILCVLEQRPSDLPVNATWIPILTLPATDMGQPQAEKKQLDAVAYVVNIQLQMGHKALISCGAGIERSPLACAWYLYKKKNMTLDDAYNLIIQKRPQVQRRDFWIQK